MRNFGVEIEINSFDQRDFREQSLHKGERPEGMDYIFDNLLRMGLETKIEDWHNSHNNTNWICKPDSSCGIEICSPVSNKLEDLIKVIDFLSKDKLVKVDSRCAFHVHFDVEDLCFDELVLILCWWIKFEHIFFDAMPDSRKNNKYCQCIGITDLFEHDEVINGKNIVSKLGRSKYISCNTFHLCKGNRNSIEFRIADSEACLDVEYSKNWILLLEHFIKVSIKSDIPDSLCWENPKKFISFLLEENLDDEVKNWFFDRILKNINSNILNWNLPFRKHSILEFNEIFENLQLDKYYICNSNLLNKMDK